MSSSPSSAPVASTSRRILIVGWVLALLYTLLLILPSFSFVHDPLRLSVTEVAQRPSAHPLGTDLLGRDVLSRLAYGARLSLAFGALVLLNALHAPY
jgi:peptide/nickel transport system permease protein